MGAPKIAHVTTVDLSLRYLLLNQLRRIQQEGYEVVGMSAAGPDVSVLKASGIDHRAIPLTRRFTPFRDLYALWALYRQMRREKFDIVHTHTPKAGLLGQLAARLAGVPVIINTLHGFYFQDDTPVAKRRFYIAMERLAARCSSVILSQNEEDVSTAVREGIVKSDKIKVLGNGIDVRQFDPARFSSVDVSRIRAEAGIPEGALVVGFVGRLVREKGILDLLRAAEAVRAQVPNAFFLIVGPFDAEKDDAVDRSAAEALRIAEYSQFTGLCEDMPPMYAAMDVLALPSYREGFPRAPMEAAAMGVPAVVTDIRGCRQTVDDGESGLLVPPGDPAALAVALIRLLNDAGLRARMGRTGRQIALDRFDERKVFDRVLSEYDRLLAARGRRQS